MSVLNNREHAEHLLTAIDRMRENGQQVSSREKGYWLDLLEYRDDQTGRCDPGRRELEAKTGHAHRTLAQMDAHAAELRIYVIEQFHDEWGRLRNRYVWNPYMLGFDNDGQPTRVLAHHASFREKVDRRRVTTGRPDNRGQVTSEKTFLDRNENVQEEEDGPVLRGQVATVSAPEGPCESSLNHRGPGSVGSSGPRDRGRKLDLVRLGELIKQRDALAPKDVGARYNLNAEIASLQR